MPINLPAPDTLAYYSPEMYLFDQVRKDYLETGQIHPEAFYLILDWKAPRARTKHRDRLIGKAGSFAKAVTQIADELHNETDQSELLKVLMNSWRFLLPTATAILAVLYPDTFTVYDRRVCDQLGAFHQLANRTKWSDELWQQYQHYVDAVRAAGPPSASLRDCDRRLWGQDKRHTMRDIELQLKPS